MDKEVEIELKNLVTKEEFYQLVSHFDIRPEAFNNQTNYYFDTYDFRLKEFGCALRIRNKKDTYTFTLKQPNDAGEGLLETHEKLDDQTAETFIEGSFGIESDMLAMLKKEFDIEASSLRSLGSLTTTRVELPYKSGLLVLDHSTYLGHEDFEVEYEITDPEQGEREFIQLLEQFNIPSRKTANKIRRFFNVKNMQK